MRASVWLLRLTDWTLGRASSVVVGVADELRAVPSTRRSMAISICGSMRPRRGGVSVRVMGASSRGLRPPLRDALFSLALYARPRRALLGLVYAAVCVYAQIGLATRYGESYGGTDFGFIAVLLLAPWLVGKAMRGRVAHIDVLALRAQKAEREREQRAREAAREERARIARELHDVIAHSVSVMVVQAGAAEEVLRQAPERALEPIRAVQATGRQALAEMARLLGMLRRDGEELGLP